MPVVRMEAADQLDSSDEEDEEDIHPDDSVSNIGFKSRPDLNPKFVNRRNLGNRRIPMPIAEEPEEDLVDSSRQAAREKSGKETPGGKGETRLKRDGSREVDLSELDSGNASLSRMSRPKADEDAFSMVHAQHMEMRRHGRRESA